jgi:hypothetical protein
LNNSIILVDLYLVPYFLKVSETTNLIEFVYFLGGVVLVSETTINIPERLQQMGKTVQEYKDAVVAQFKDVEVDVQDWTFNVGKTQEEYTVEVKVKLVIKPKTKQ